MLHRSNKAMDALIAGVNLEDCGVFDWPARIRMILEGGWVRRESGALVLAKIARSFKHQERDCYDLTDYETRVNQFDVPDNGIDLSSARAMTILAARAYVLTTRFMSSARSVGDLGRLLGLISVGVGYEEKPRGSIHMHEVHEGERPWIRLDDLDGYLDEAIMVVEMGDGR